MARIFMMQRQKEVRNSSLLLETFAHKIGNRTINVNKLSFIFESAFHTHELKLSDDVDCAVSVVHER